MNEFKFDLGAAVSIIVSGEKGHVIGRAEYTSTALKSYLIRYQTADGKATETWWGEDALEASE